MSVTPGSGYSGRHLHIFERWTWREFKWRLLLSHLVDLNGMLLAFPGIVSQMWSLSLHECLHRYWPPVSMKQGIICGNIVAVPQMTDLRQLHLIFGNIWLILINKHTLYWHLSESVNWYSIEIGILWDVMQCKQVTYLRVTEFLGHTQNILCLQCRKPW